MLAHWESARSDPAHRRSHVPRPARTPRSPRCSLGTQISSARIAHRARPILVDRTRLRRRRRPSRHSRASPSGVGTRVALGLAVRPRVKVSSPRAIRPASKRSALFPGVSHGHVPQRPPPQRRHRGGRGRKRGERHRQARSPRGPCRGGGGAASAAGDRSWSARPSWTPCASAAWRSRSRWKDCRPWASGWRRRSVRRSG